MQIRSEYLIYSSWYNYCVASWLCSAPGALLRVRRHLMYIIIVIIAQQYQIMYMCGCACPCVCVYVLAYVWRVYVCV